jgi:hypothetical protein
MTLVLVLLGIVLLLFLIGQIRLGGRVEYSREGVTAWIRVCGFSKQLFPKPTLTRSQEEKAAEKKRKKEEKARRKKAKKAKKSSQKKEETPQKPQEKTEKKPGGSLELVRQLLPVMIQALGALKKRIRIDRLIVHYVAGGTDAAQVAISYGKLSAGAAAVVALLNNNFKVKRQEVTMDVNFLAESPTIYLDAGLSLTVGQILYLAVRYGIASLKVFLRQRRKQNSPQEKTGDQKQKGGV